MGEALDDGTNPEYPETFPTESQVIAEVARGSLPCTTCGSRVDLHTEQTGHVATFSMTTMTDWQRRDLEDEIEMDLL